MMNALNSQFPLLSQLAELGIQAKRGINDRVLLAPPDKVTPRVSRKVTELKQAILAELAEWERIRPASKRVENQREAPEEWAHLADTAPQAQARVRTRWDDPLHDLDAVEAVMVSMFALCAKLNWQATQYWDGPPAVEPARPYCYVRADLVDGAYRYYPILADVDSVDYIWTEAITDGTDSKKRGEHNES